MNYLSLFSGIGGLDLGLDRAGWTCVGQVEKDPFCRAVLGKHWPEVPKHDDVRTAVEWWGSRPRPAVHAVVGGFPCQPVSSSGAQLGEEDERWRWPEMAAVVGALRPDWVLGENVSGLLATGLLGVVLGDLARIGYRARAGTLTACAVGAPHTRERLFIVAHPEGERRGAGRVQPGGDGQAAGVGAAQFGSERRAWWAREPGVGRVAYGVPGRVDRVRALGNAVVPAVGEYIGRLIGVSS